MKLNPFSKEQIIDRIKFENPWWNTDKIDEYYQKMKRRIYLDLFKPLVFEKKVKRAVVLMGPRRVGKTVMIYHTIHELIKSGISPKKICYLSIETPIYNNIGLEQLFQLCREAVGDNDYKGFYIFFDEIQYLRDWEIHLKSLVDSYLGTKFIVSGSAAAALKLKSIESGAGRFTDFLLPPLTFHEYIVFKDLEVLVYKHSKSDGFFTTSKIDALNKHFVDYINYGGYPEVIFNDTIQKDPGRYIRNDIIDKVLLRDLPSLYGIDDIQELNSLFTSIAYNSGNEVSLDALSVNSGVSKNTLKKYITYLEAAFLIKIVHRIDFSAKRFKRANFFKVYLTNPSLRSALFAPIKENDPFMGNMIETAIYSQWQHSKNTLYYARWKKGEIDIVHLGSKQKPWWVTEIKWTNKVAENVNELANIKAFCIKHKLDFAIVTTYDYEGKVKRDKMAYEFIPSSTYCYTIGRNIVEGKIRQGM